MRPTALALATLLPAALAAEIRVYLGTGGGSSSKGIYVASFNPQTGEVGEPRLAAEVKNPTFLALHPNRRFLYAVGEIWEGPESKDGPVSSFEIRPDGLLKPLNQRASGGAGPCFIGLDPSSRVALAACYGGGSVASFPVLADGRLGERASLHKHSGSSVNERRQKGPHAHSIYASPDGRFAFAPDLGIDKVMIYRLDASTGVLTPHEPAFAEIPPGGGPRHLSFHPNGRFAYVNNELLCSVTAFAFDADKGALTPLTTVSTLPEGVERLDSYSTSEILVHEDGAYLYCANRGHDTIAVFALGADGHPRLLQNHPCGGNIPRNFNIDPSGRWLLVANQNSDQVSVLKLDPESGRLSDGPPGVALGRPMCVKFWVAP
jgi:6-phosphogluconolactonase